jgi:DNA-binding IclR family transcriptional regulator
MRRLTNRTITDPPALIKELDRVRRHGVAYDRGESFPTIVGVAAPVIDPADVPVAAVSISGVAGRINLSRLDSAVRTTALAVSRTLAWGGV